MSPLPELHRLPLPRPLAGPPAEGSLVLGPSHGVDAVTGGGLVALVHPGEGLVSLWDEKKQHSGRLAIQWEGRSLPSATILRLGSGGWEREIPLPHGRKLRERAVLPDSASALILHWEVLAPGEEATDRPRTAETSSGAHSDARGSTLPRISGELPLLSLTLQGPGGGEGSTLHLAPAKESGGDDTQALVITPGGTPFTRIAPRLAPPHARERARYSRSGRADLRIQGTGVDLPPALQALDRSALGLDREGRPAGPFLIGVEERTEPDERLGQRTASGFPEAHPRREEPGGKGPVPRFARGETLAELGLGALAAGRPEMAVAALRELVREETAPPLPLLHLAGQIPAWTGSMAALEEIREGLDQAVERLIRRNQEASGLGSASPPAAFPGPLRVLEALAQGVERSGDRWSERLQTVARSLAGQGPPDQTHGKVAKKEPADPHQPGSPSPSSGSQGNDPPAKPSLVLPVLAGPTEPPPPPAADAQATLPPPEAFASMAAPVLTSRRGLHAARLLRSWVEGRLGVRPDAASGRVTLSVDARTLPSPLEVEGLRIGDASMSIDCRLEEGTCSFGGYQTGGRVPLNLVLHLTIPFPPPVAVEVGGESSEVPGTPVEGGSRLSLQFPLDPERRIVVEPDVDAKQQ